MTSGEAEANENRVFRSLTSSSSSRDRNKNMTEYGSFHKQREILVDKSHRNNRESVL